MASTADCRKHDACLTALSSELLLQVFRSLTPPSTYSNSSKVDLQNLRLTCKTLRPPATELFFENWPILLWYHKDGFEPTKSFRLLCEHPALAALVKKVTIRTAACGHEYVLRLAKMDWPEFHFSQAHEAYRQMPTNVDIAMELVRTYSVLPNVQRVELRMATLHDVQFYNIFQAYIRARGLEVGEEILLSKSQEVKLQKLCFPYQTPSVVALFEAVPQTCRNVEVEIDVENFSRNFDVTGFCSRNSHLTTHLSSLDLDLRSVGFMKDYGTPTLLNFTNHFQSLTHLGIRLNSYTVEAKSAWERRARGISNAWLMPLRLASLKHLRISQCVICISELLNLSNRFPVLETMEIKNAVLTPPMTEPISPGKTTWLEVAQRIHHDYKGQCILSFPTGPILEIDGVLESVQSEYAIYPAFAITRTLKTPALQTLTAISGRMNVNLASVVSQVYLDKSNSALVQRYIKMTEHTPPNVKINWNALQFRYQRGKEVDTEGITYIYHDIVHDSSPQPQSYWPCPPGVHPLDWG